MTMGQKQSNERYVVPKDAVGLEAEDVDGRERKMSGKSADARCRGTSTERRAIWGGSRLATLV